MENCYFNITMKQTIGILVGIDPAAFWVNYFLYSYKGEYISSLISSDKSKARYFHSTKHFNDDTL